MYLRPIIMIKFFKSLRIVACLSLTMGIIFVLGCDDISQSQNIDISDKEELIIKKSNGEKHIFLVEIADSSEERALGLMYRRELPSNAGMLFKYLSPQYITMWMANTFLSLDMIFISRDGYILNIEERTIPQSRAAIPSSAPAIAVLELNAGITSKHNIKAGDLVIHRFFVISE